jgi:hypothetical protein
MRPPRLNRVALLEVLMLLTVSCAAVLGAVALGFGSRLTGEPQVENAALGAVLGVAVALLPPV